MSKIQQFIPDEDSQLLLSWHRGDLSAFETLVWKYQKRIFNLAILLTGDHEAAATATENSFLTAYQEIRTLTGRSRFSTWLVAITLKECRNLNYFIPWPCHRIESHHRNSRSSGVDGLVLRGGSPGTPSGPEGSSGNW